MWSLAPHAHARHILTTASSRVAPIAAQLSRSSPTSSSSSAISSLNSSFSAFPSSSTASGLIGSIRYGSSFSQSPRANRAASRASGSTYRTPKGRPGPNTHHVKEPLPDLTTFADPKLPKGARRKQRALERKNLPKHDRLDFSIVGGVVTPLIGLDSKRKLLKRVKTPVHKALKLAQAKEMEWNLEEQTRAEMEAERFIQAEAEAIEVERQRLLADPSLTPEERQELLNLLEADALVFQQENDALHEAIEERKARELKKVPKFGIQTVLKFLKEFDIVVHPTTTTSTSSKTNKKTKDDSNPLDQDILVYDVITRFNFADYIVAVKAQSSRQMRHLAESCYKMARSLNACSSNPRTLSMEGRGREDWMLVDCGFIWLYFFNKKPVQTLPNGQGIFGVSFHVPQPSVHVSNFAAMSPSSSSNSSLGVGQARIQSTTSSNDAVDGVDDGGSYTFQARNNPFEPMMTTTTPLHDEVMPSSMADSSSTSSHVAGDIVGGEEVRSTSSTIHSTMWYEPTPDNPNVTKPSVVNAKKAQQQMEQSVLDQTFVQGSGERMKSSSSSNVIVDADYVATSSPLGVSEGLDPSLLLLHNSNFIHPVLENLEKTYGDLRVPTSNVTKLKDYCHEDLKNDIVHLRTPSTIDDVVEEKEQDGKKRRSKKKTTTSTKKSQQQGYESIEIQDMTTTIVPRA